MDSKLKNRITEYCDLDKDSCSILNTSNIFNIDNLSENISLIINLGITNNIRRINKFHEAVNNKIGFDNIYISCSETLEERRGRVRSKTPFGLKNFIRTIDFIYKRVIPKLPIFKNIYFSLTRGHNRVMSKSEILGRLISCGFDVIGYFEHKNLLYLISKKNKLPDYNMKVSYGPLFNMKRIGFNKEIIRVYKFRTMYPYSEYCQDLITKENELSDTGKIANDFRITTWGKLMRKFWIDELPNLINFFKGDMKLIGVRPVSEGYFNNFPSELKDMRIKVRPACIGIHYCIIPENKDDVVSLEIKYLKQYLKRPIVTDIKYFYYFMYNIIFKNVRSG